VTELAVAHIGGTSKLDIKFIPTMPNPLKREEKKF